jgi:hypothetical protein
MRSADRDNSASDERFARKKAKKSPEPIVMVCYHSDSVILLTRRSSISIYLRQAQSAVILIRNAEKFL